LHNWEDLVRAHLHGLKLDSRREQEIFAELASHLEDVFSELRRRGIPEEEAFRRALKEIPNWKKLRRRLRAAATKEDAVNQRFRSLWIPGLSTFALLMAASLGVFRAHMFPRGIVIGSTVSFLIYVPWLAAFPATGALGAYWSRRMGGSVAARIGVCLFPMIILAGLFLVAELPILLRILSLPDPMFHATKTRVLRYDLVCALHWVVYPCVALLLGALPVALIAPAAHPASPRVA
jgi:hypothetical protein